MTTLADTVPIPAKESVNKNLTSASEQVMLRKFGKPGALTAACSSPTGHITSRIKFGIDVGPFKVSGLDFAVESLRQVFAEVERKAPRLFNEVKTEGMLCVRHKHSSTSHFSNHSWGAAIDLFYGSGVVQQGTARAHRGIVELVPFFNKRGWYWGGEFSGNSVDSMHFELAAETIGKIHASP